jgi:hypothetical protein
MTSYAEPVSVDFVRGDATGLTIPAHGETLRSLGANFLTEAFRCFGALSKDNSVTKIVRLEPFVGGTSGHKLLLSVEYARAEAGLHSDLFVKFSRDFTDGYRDRRRFELGPEVRLASLSRLPAFPIRVPKAYFADIHAESGTGLLITEQIPIGRAGIEPIRRKCMDHELADPLEYYRATVTNLARLAAAHKSGALSPEVDSLFPVDLAVAANSDRIPWNTDDLHERVARYAAFAKRYPQLLPPHLRSPEFIARWDRDVVRILQHEAAIKRFLHTDANLIALCHWNAHIDNAWFWRDGSGALQCGLFDWQRARPMNVVYALWGCLSGAGLETWDHLDALLALFIQELHSHAGPLLDAKELTLHLDLYVAFMGLVEIMNFPEVVITRLPEAATASGPRDPVFEKNEIARTDLNILTVFLNLWHRHDFGARLDQMLARQGSHTTLSSA